MTPEEAARVAVNVLTVLADEKFVGHAILAQTLRRCRARITDDYLKDAPPVAPTNVYTPPTGEMVHLPWSKVAPGDHVTAGNCAAFRVHDITDYGTATSQRMTVRLIDVDGDAHTWPVPRDAQVAVHRGEFGMAVDVLTGAGFDPVQVMGS